jgi:hypothetical protein
MADRPDWLGDYLHPHAEFGDDIVARRSRVLIELAGRGRSWGATRWRRSYRNAQACARRDAERVWTGHCPGAALAGGLADPGFDRFGGDEALPFGWQASLSGDVALRAVDKSGGNRALMMRNRGTVSRLVLSQAVSLEPGTYRLTGRVAPGHVAGSVACGGRRACRGSVRRHGARRAKCCAFCCEPARVRAVASSGQRRSRARRGRARKVG